MKGTDAANAMLTTTMSAILGRNEVEFRDTYTCTPTHNQLEASHYR